MDLLRFTTAGSVDDGKSTLIGRLLYDCKSIFDDQLRSLESSSQRRGEASVNLALLTDGLRAEREQNITIDVAYRYFATPRRKFIIADTPGHIQYTRNMVTGASTADLAIILVDARKGVLTQSRRHAFIASLLQTPHLVVAINKMDMVDYDEAVFVRILQEFSDFAQKLEVKAVTYIPISALHGDNVVTKSERMPWYNGTTLLHHLEHVNAGSRRNLIDFRFPVQYTIRPDQDFRGYAGRIASGTIKTGEAVLILPSQKMNTIAEIRSPKGSVESAEAGDSVVIRLADHMDVARGDMIVRTHNRPTVSTHFEAFLCWMSEEAMQKNRVYIMQHAHQTVQAYTQEVIYRINVDTLHREDAEELQLNEIGRVKIAAARPICWDPYRLNNETGNFILIDPSTCTTIAAGMILPVRTEDAIALEEERAESSSNVHWFPWNISREDREKRNGQKAAVLWFTGLSGAGKSTIAQQLEHRLHAMNRQTMLLDGDQVRHGLCGDLGFSEAAREENIRRVAHVARLFFEHGNIVLCTFISPFIRNRALSRNLIPEGRFIEIHVACDLEEAEKRDPKGLYAKARRGEIKDFTGIDSPYEEPEAPEIRLDTMAQSPDQAVETVLQYLKEHGLLEG